MKYREFKEIITLEHSHRPSKSIRQFKKGVLKKEFVGDTVQIKKRMPGGIILLK